MQWYFLSRQLYTAMELGIRWRIPHLMLHQQLNMVGPQGPLKSLDPGKQVPLNPKNNAYRMICFDK